MVVTRSSARKAALNGAEKKGSSKASRTSPKTPARTLPRTTIKSSAKAATKTPQPGVRKRISFGESLTESKATPLERTPARRRRAKEPSDVDENAEDKSKKQSVTPASARVLRSQARRPLLPRGGQSNDDSGRTEKLLSKKNEAPKSEKRRTRATNNEESNSINIDNPEYMLIISSDEEEAEVFDETKAKSENVDDPEPRGQSSEPKSSTVTLKENNGTTSRGGTQQEVDSVMEGRGPCETEDTDAVKVSDAELTPHPDSFKTPDARSSNERLKKHQSSDSKIRHIQKEGASSVAVLDQYENLGDHTEEHSKNFDALATAASRGENRTAVDANKLQITKADDGEGDTSKAAPSSPPCALPNKNAEVITKRTPERTEIESPAAVTKDIVPTKNVDTGGVSVSAEAGNDVEMGIAAVSPRVDSPVPEDEPMVDEEDFENSEVQETKVSNFQPAVNNDSNAERSRLETVDEIESPRSALHKDAGEPNVEVVHRDELTSNGAFKGTEQDEELSGDDAGSASKKASLEGEDASGAKVAQNDMQLADNLDSDSGGSENSNVDEAIGKQSRDCSNTALNISSSRQNAEEGALNSEDTVKNPLFRGKTASTSPQEVDIDESESLDSSDVEESGEAMDRPRLSSPVDADKNSHRVQATVLKIAKSVDEDTEKPAGSENIGSKQLGAWGEKSNEDFIEEGALHPEVFLKRSSKISNKCRDLLQAIYGEQSSTTFGVAAMAFQFAPKRKTKNQAALGPLTQIETGPTFEVDQIWEELELRNAPLHQQLEREVKSQTTAVADKIEKGQNIEEDSDIPVASTRQGLQEREENEMNGLWIASEDAESSQKEESGSEEVDIKSDVQSLADKKRVRFASEELSENDSESETGEVPRKKEGIEDGFFNLEGMEAFANEAEALALDGRLAASDDDSEDSAGSDSEYDDDQLRVIGKKKSSKIQVGEDSIRYDDFFAPPMNEKMKDDASRALRRATLFDVGSDAEDSDQEDAEAEMTPLERSRVSMRQEIDEMEKAAVEKKPWQLRGEVIGDARPANSALDANFEHDIAFQNRAFSAPESTEKVEDIIRQRIFDKLFDDVVRPLPPEYEQAKDMKKDIPEVSQEKPKEGLGDLYAREFAEEREKISKAAEAAEVVTKDEEPKETPEQAEVNRFFKRLCTKLDALATLHFTPSAPKIPEEMTVKPNVPALAAEEAIPAAVSDAALLAPHEVHDAKKEKAVGDLEKTKVDRRRSRRATKKRLAMFNKRNEAVQKQKEVADPLVGEQKRAERALERRGKKIHRREGPEKGPSQKRVKTGDFSKSNRFFANLQDSVSAELASSKLKRKQEKDNSTHRLPAAHYKM